ncbi:hypothetical protein [Tautonia plasticadhaerens]|uniref:Uncharacterized protein n=1 Tax=Tautonia plasticadhaerens TaxID=2527974 RepID=A0A518HAB1_9BACT|nr:hypothetical protein [Tautonia plasticadhaerens]QDV37788.1 hypothetical protein ElP_57340 [Tautonia plasticadhaerens]
MDSTPCSSGTAPVVRSPGSDRVDDHPIPDTPGVPRRGACLLARGTTGSIPRPEAQGDVPGRGIELRAEVGRVRGKLATFRDRYLAVLVADRAQVERDGAMQLLPWASDPAERRACQAAVAVLERAMSVPGERHLPAPPELQALAELVDVPSEPGFVIRDGRIDWRIAPFPEWRPDLREASARELLALVGCPAEGERPATEELRHALPRVRRWFLGRVPGELTGRSDLAEYLPLVAVLDPAFARTLLDARTIRAAVRRNPALEPEERAQRLRLIDTGFYRGELGLALARVLGALANDQFDQIGRFLDLPEVHGNQGYLIPKYLLVVLTRKVVTLQDLAVGVDGRRNRDPRIGRPATALMVD